MTTTITAPVAPAVTAPVAPVAPVVNPADASNVATINALWCKAEAHYLDRQLATAVTETFGTGVDAIVHKIMVADGKLATDYGVTFTVPVWKTLEYRSLKMWVAEVLGDQLKNWDATSRNRLVSVLVDKGFSGTDVARMTGTSEATVSRAAKGATGKPAEPSTPTSRARKAVDNVADKCDDAEKYPTADLQSLAFDTIRSLDKQISELAKRGANVTKLVTAVQLLGQKDFRNNGPRSGAEGTTGNGVTAPAPVKPGQSRK